METITDLTRLKAWTREMKPVFPLEKTWTIMFDLPENGCARIHVQRYDATVVIINCLTWDETYLLRKLVRFGSNHEQRATDWEQLGSYLNFLAISCSAEREELKEEARNATLG